MAEQLQQGFPIGPQSSLAGKVAALISELTGDERVTFCCTGSEAVMGALRLARAVTGRKRVVAFAGAYHGGFDEVLVRGVRKDGAPRSLPAASGIMPEAVANLTILEYGDPESLAWIRAHAEELAAVLVEPVQSRHPDLQPRAFLQEIRAITKASGSALIFDEVVTGFPPPSGRRAGAVRDPRGSRDLRESARRWSADRHPGRGSALHGCAGWRGSGATATPRSPKSR